MAYPFYIVDVFAEMPYSGNQLAVVVGAAGLSDDTMQQLAAETNYSETTFLTPDPESDGGYRMRLFTPAREIAFAGHPILGTAWVLRHFVLPDAPLSVRLNLPREPIPVTFEQTDAGSEVAWFRAPPVTLGATCSAERMARALGLSPDDLDTAYPVQHISAGTGAVIVPLRSLDALRRARLDLDVYAGLAAEGFPPLTYLFTRETRQPENDLCARFFFEAHGVREDPATGNGAAFLGAWLLEHRFFPESRLALRIEQGHEVRRPSVVRLRAQMKGETREVDVGGQVIATVRGELMGVPVAA